MENIILRKAKADDLDAMWENVWQDNELAEYMLWKPVENYDEAKIRLEKTIEFQRTNYAFYVCLEDTDEAIGFIGAKEISEGVFEDCGICISRKYQGRGYGKQALVLFLKMIREDLNARKFVYSCFEQNLKSKKLCESLGFKYEYTKECTRNWDGLNYKALYFSKMID